jgi:hypothetical protein
MIRPASVTTALFLSALVNAVPLTAQFELRGLAVNHGVAANPSSSGIQGTLTWRSKDPSSEGELAVGEPLEGSGVSRAKRWADSVVIISVATVGDTIAWLGRLGSSRVSGEYIVLGGRFRGQGGLWFLSGKSASRFGISEIPDPRAISAIARATAMLRSLPTPTSPPPSMQPASDVSTTGDDWSFWAWIIGIAAVVAVASFGVRFLLMGAWTGRVDSPAKPGDYAVICPTCGKRRLSEARELWFMRGFLLAAQYGRRVMVGCRQCVIYDGLRLLGVNALTSWWSIPWGFGAPLVLLQNVIGLLLPKDDSELDSALSRAGISASDVKLDDLCLTREQRAVVEGASQILATAIWADGVQQSVELERAVSILTQFSGERLPRHVVLRLIDEGRRTSRNLAGFEAEVRQTLLVMALDIAMADRELSLPEIAMLYAVGLQLGFGKVVVDDLLGFSAQSEGREGRKAGSRRNRDADEVARALAVLGVAQNATMVEVKQAWRSAILKVHPDRAGNDKRRQAEFTARSQEVNWAYDVLQRASPQTA